MRESFESLKRSKSVFNRLRYYALYFGSIMFPATRRARLRLTWLRAIRYKPSFCRPVRACGLNGVSRIPRVVVSLTSYPGRIKTVHRTIGTLLSQTFKPDLLILWLSEKQFPRREKDLPRYLTSLCRWGLSIRWCVGDIRSYKKLIPALTEFPDDIIVTADDDFFYREDWLKILVDAYHRDVRAIQCHLVRSVQIKNGVIVPYGYWPYGGQHGRPCFSHLIMGGGGALYPPHCLYADVLDVNKFMRLSPYADDLWFWAMALMKGTRIAVVANANGMPDADLCAVGSMALAKINLDEGGNDRQLSAIFSEYPKVRELLLEECQGV